MNIKSQGRCIVVLHNVWLLNPPVTAIWGSAEPVLRDLGFECLRREVNAAPGTRDAVTVSCVRQVQQF
jgi:hypothetical protein